LSVPPVEEVFGPDDTVTHAARLERLAGGGYCYALADDMVRIEARYLRREGHQLHAELDVKCEWAGVSRHGDTLSCGDLNLSSQSQRKTLAKHCAERAKTKADEFDWQLVVDAACLEIIQAERRGADVIVLDDADDRNGEENFECFGIQVPADAPSLLIAHGGSLKSLLMLLILGTLAGLGHVVLYLDWEWTAARHKMRKRRLFGDIRLDGLRYLKCHGPLVHEADRIRQYCDKHNVVFIGVDSVGWACDGKLIDDDVAIRFHRALSTLPAAICAAHVPKSSLGPDAKGDAVGPFGSVFFSNLCRMSWLVKKQPGADKNLITVGLFPQKQNDGDPHPEVGLEFAFCPDRRINVRKIDLLDVEGLADRLPLASRIGGALRTGPLSYAELATRLDAKVDSIIKAVNRNNVFVKVPSQDGIQRIALAERRIQQ
jgi:hypothetical protein